MTAFKPIETLTYGHQFFKRISNELIEHKKKLNEKDIHYIYKAVKYSNGKNSEWLDQRENY